MESETIINRAKICICKECGKYFNNNQNLKEHIKNSHPKCFGCNECIEKFEESWRMENHLRSHKDYEIYGCEVCDKKVSLKWRMEKHVQCHNKITKFCHYHNNEKHCPCNDIGCKFKHEYSNQCRFGDKASS